MLLANVSSAAAEFGLLGLVLNFMYAFLFILFTTRRRLFLPVYFALFFCFIFFIWYLLNFLCCCFARRVSLGAAYTFHLAWPKQMNFTCTFRNSRFGFEFRTLSKHCAASLSFSHSHSHSLLLLRSSWLNSDSVDCFYYFPCLLLLLLWVSFYFLLCVVYTFVLLLDGAKRSRAHSRMILCGARRCLVAGSDAAVAAAAASSRLRLRVPIRVSGFVRTRFVFVGGALYLSL